MELNRVVNEVKKLPVEEYFNQTNSIKPLVTIIICTYNHVHFIRNCLEGVLNQKTTFDYEIYLGDDDSTDGTREICLEYAKKYPDKIRLFLHKNENKIYIAGKKTGRFNLLYALHSARGEYIALCDGDDVWIDESKIQTQLEFLESNKQFSMCFTDINLIDHFGVTTRMSALDYKTEVYTHESFTGLITAPTSTLMFRRNALSVIPSELLHVLNADHFIASMLSEKGPVKFINKVTSCYRRHEKGMYVGISVSDRQRSKIATLKAMLNFFKSRIVKKNLRKKIGRAYGVLLYEAFRKKNGKIFFQTILSVFNFNFLSGRTSAFYFLFFLTNRLYFKKAKKKTMNS